MLLGQLSAVVLGAAMGVAMSAAPAGATTGQHPWAQTNGSAAMSRANLTESVLTRQTVVHAGFRRSLATPPADLADEYCNGPGVSSPLLKGKRVYDVAVDRISMYNATNGHLRWQAQISPSSRPSSSRWRSVVACLLRASLTASRKAIRSGWCRPSTR